MKHDYDAIAKAAGWILDPEYAIWFHPESSPDHGYVDSDTLCHCEGLNAPTPSPLPPIHFHELEQYCDYTG